MTIGIFCLGTTLRFTLLFLFVFASCVFARPAIVLNDYVDKYAPGSALNMYCDTTSKFPVDSIVQSKFRSHFAPSSRLVPNLGFSSSAYWFHFDIIDSSSKNREWILDIPMPSLHYVDFYIACEDSVIFCSHAGFLIDKNKRMTPFRNPAIQLPKINNKSLSVFCRVTGETPIIVPVFIREKNRYIAYNDFREFFLGLYFGALFMMAIYHFYLFLSIADRGYLWLSFFIVCFGFGQMSAVYGFLSDWGVKNLGSQLRWLHVVNFLAAFFGCYLSRSMIGSQKNAPRCDAAIKIIAGILLLFTVISPFISFTHAEQGILLANFIPLPCLILAAIISIRRGHRPALYYLIATSTFILGLLVYNMIYGLNLFPFNEFVYFTPNVSFIITLAMFSVGLTDHINRLKKEREDARKQIIADLKENLKLQKEKSLVERELEHSRKIASVGRLLSGVAHDMKNLLVPVQGHALLIRKQCNKDDSLYREANRLVSATNRLQDLAAMLVDVSRKESSGLRRINLNSIINQTGSLLKHSAKMGISLELILSQEEPFIDADEGMVCSAILNIGINAIEAIPGTGHVTLKTGIVNLHKDHDAIKQSGCLPGLYAFVAITDNGIGMHDEIKSHLFEPFFTTKSKTKGTGLGLTNVFNCMKAHNGCIDVQSEPQKGCCITIYFPAQTIAM